MALSRPDDSNRRTCWVCFATDEDDREAKWTRPCCCKGTSKWVHQSCLQRWIDEKQGGSLTTVVSCPQCNTEYRIKFPPLGPVLQLIDYADKMINKVCPLAAAGIFIGSVYWSSVTYGAVTVLQVMGHKEGVESMENADPLFLLVGLPTIPLTLILFKMIRWEDKILRLWRKYSIKIPFWNKSYKEEDVREPAELPPLTDPTSFTRSVCGALILPTMATVFGKLFFNSMKSGLKRCLLGGITFTVLKGAFKMYYKQQQYIRQALRLVEDYPDGNDL